MSGHLRRCLPPASWLMIPPGLLRSAETCAQPQTVPLTFTAAVAEGETACTWLTCLDQRPEQQSPVHVEQLALVLETGPVG